MQGGVILLRGTGADALRYVEADRSRADDYYLSDSTGVQYAVLDASGEAVSSRVLTADEYAGWVDWINPDTGEQMGKPRLAGLDRQGSPNQPSQRSRNSEGSTRSSSSTGHASCIVPMTFRKAIVASCGEQENGSIELPVFISGDPIKAISYHPNRPFSTASQNHKE